VLLRHDGDAGRLSDVRVRWRPWGAVVVLLAAGFPVTARAATEQVIAARNVGADVGVEGDGRAFLVSPVAPHSSARLSSVRVRSAAPGALFGPWRTLLHTGRSDRAVDAAVAADGSGVIVLQSDTRPHRRVRVVTFDAQGRVRPGVVVSRGDRADFAALAVARGGAAVVVWFRHRGARRWRLEAVVRQPGAAGFRPPQPLSRFMRRPCCTSVSVAIGDRGDAVATWRSTVRPAVWAALRKSGAEFRRPQRLAGESSDDPRAVMGAGGTAAIVYSVQRVPLRAGDGLRLHRAVSGGAFGAAENVNPRGGVTIGEVAVTPAGQVLVAWVDRADSEAGARVRVSEARPAGALVDSGEFGTKIAPRALAVAAEDDGRAVVAWSQRVSSEPSYSEQAVAATRQGHAPGFGPGVALGQPWRTAEPSLARLVPGGGALVVWTGSRFGPPRLRRTALVVTRLP
jgi:hypothetical protein